MRKYTLQCTLILVSAILLFAACKKEGTSTGSIPEPDQSSKLLLRNAFAGLRSAPQELEVNAGVLQGVYASNNTKLTFYPNSFRDRNGSIITTGQIKIRIIEMYRPGSVIANRSSATASGRLLKNRGQVIIKAYRAGIEVYPTVFGIGFAQSGVSSQPANLFYGDQNNDDSTTVWTNAGWNPGTSVAQTVVDTGITAPINMYQFDSCRNFNWISCQQFIEYTEPTINLSLIMKDSFNSFNDTNTQVFIVVPSQNSVTWLQTYNPSIRGFSFAPKYVIPKGTNFHAVSISMKNGTYYYDQKLNLNATLGFVDTLKPMPKTLIDIFGLLNGL